ncbi:MAG: leader peptidase (prepilin peptidase) / N-methyltransferase [Patescibacteria group bacterium]|nr:leader peptidase (prepilin peptidase) / N-methyltransferase [Patescibacteria group bacterium]
MILFIFLSSFVFGTIIGSFLNVVALRYKTGKNLSGRSMCFSCGTGLKWFELIPILSFVFQKGKCRTCRSPFSAQYPAVEALTGLVFAITTTFFYFLPIEASLVLLPFFLLCFSILIVVAIYDIRHMIIPDMLVFLFAFLGLLFMVLTNSPEYLLTFPGILDLFAGPILALPFALLWALSRGQWMGFGDAKLALGIGWLLGLSSGLSALALGMWIGAFWSIAKMATAKMKHKKKKVLTMKSEIPLAPFLILATFIQFIFAFDFFQLNVLLSL